NPHKRAAFLAPETFRCFRPAVCGHPRRLTLGSLPKGAPSLLPFSPDRVYVCSQASLAKETVATASALPLAQRDTAGDLRACVNWVN
ncbi:hypothetical protein CPAR01_09726, partial [Colletotrichum paranaense]